MVNTSVIIPCYNSANTLDLQLECLVAQVDAEEFEVIAVDNKSTDNTVEVLKRWQDRLNLNIVPAFEHAGVSYARNVGVRESQGEKLIFIDSDDAIPERYISDCQRSLDEVPICITRFALAARPGTEDHDFAIRLFEKGYQLLVQRSTTIAYRIDSQYQKNCSKLNIVG